MKRCPECRRDYYDDTLRFCLEDGTSLVQGSVPASPEVSDEPATAILSEPPALAGGQLPTESPTRAFNHTTDQTAIFHSGAEAEPQKNLGEVSERQGPPAHRAAKSLGDNYKLVAGLAIAILLLVGGFLGYRYFASSLKQIESIAVMPFVNAGGNADVEYLSDGMTETLISSLSSVPNLSVKPRSTVFRYKGKETDAKTIGKELNVQAILNGRVVQRGDQLTLSLELVDVEKDIVLWSQQYVRKQSDLVSLQSEIARDVSGKLKSKLSGADAAKVEKNYTANPEAYQLYLKGRFYWNKRTGESIKQAIEFFNQAIEKDPNYALAYAGLADSYLVMQDYAGTPTSDVLPKAKTAALRALQIDDSLAEAHASLAQIYVNSWQWVDAEEEFRRAIQLNPNYPTVHQWYSLELTSMGRLDEAMAEIKRAQELDPLSGIIATSVARAYVLRGDLDKAIALCNNFIELDPNFPQTHGLLALAYQRQGRYEEAIAEAQKGVELSRRAGDKLAVLGYCYAVAGKRSEALAILRELEEKHVRRESTGTYLAWVYAGLGDKDQAFAWLEKDFQDRRGTLAIQITANIILDTLRSDPRYADLLHRMGLRP